MVKDETAEFGQEMEKHTLISSSQIGYLSKDPDYEDHGAYKLAIETLAKRKDPSEFSNKGPIHASYVLGSIFRTAEQDVKLFTGSLEGPISDRDYYLDNLRKLLKDGIPLTVIFQKTPNAKSKALALLNEYSHCNVYLHKLNHENFFEHHFCIADQRMYRLETSSEFQAACSFNDPKTSKTLNEVFGSLLVNSTPIQNS